MSLSFLRTPSTLYYFVQNVNSLVFFTPTFHLPNFPSCLLCLYIFLASSYTVRELCTHRSTCLMLRQVSALRVLGLHSDALAWSKHLVQFCHSSRWGPRAERWGSRVRNHTESGRRKRHMKSDTLSFFILMFCCSVICMYPSQPTLLFVSHFPCIGALYLWFP